MANPIDTFNRLREDLFRYYDTPFRLRLDGVMKERRALHDCLGGAWQEPWVEVLRPYALTGLGVSGALQEAQAPSELSSFTRCGLLDFEDLFLHQQQAVASCMSGQNVAVTAGTGSGKTEAFLLPVVAMLLRESQNWQPTQPDPPYWWRTEDSPWIASRTNEKGRQPGVRGLILYPMNALVEDQLVRLRRSLDSKSARDWLDANRGGHRFYFGRYTGKSPVSGRPDNRNALRRLRRHLFECDRRSDQVEDDDRRYYIPRLDGAEMICRWDMQAYPPDILITNYSMLNIILLRSIDSGLIDKTRLWLKSDQRNVFHVVVDELHMYRGTAGTEVAYLIRKLLHLLDLDPDSPQVRFIATSASLGEPSNGLKFLSDFFGASPDSFDIHQGTLRPLGVEATASLSEYATQFEQLAETTLEDDLVEQLLKEAQTEDTLAAVTNGQAVALSTLDSRLFPEHYSTSPSQVSLAMQGLLRSIESFSTDSGFLPPRIRTHMFFRNIEGAWACTDPHCPEVDPTYAHHDRKVGKLWSKPRHRCECGGRVLRLLYCQTCGDLFFGGFVAPSLNPGERLHDEERYMVAEVGDLDSLPDQAQERETCRDFTIYWPRPISEAELATRPLWTREGYTFEFRPAAYNHDNGRLRVSRQGQTGWTYEVSDNGISDSKIHKIPPLPIFCPQCGTDWESYKGVLPVTDRNRTRSPIGKMGTGYEKLGQVITDGLIRELRGEDDNSRKLVLFSDSRQDAAKLSAGLEKRHYQDLIREMLVKELLTGTHIDLQGALAWADGDRSDESRAAWNNIKMQFPDLHAALNDLRDEEPGAKGQVYDIAQGLLNGRSVSQLALAVEARLVALGVSPAGPDPSGNRYPPGDDQGIRWDELYEWPQASHPRRLSDLETADQLELRRTLDKSMLKECLLNVFAGNGRDLESLALAKPEIAARTVTPPEPLSETTFLQIVQSSIRILGGDRRLQGLRFETAETPASVRRYWTRVSQIHGIDSAQLASAVKEAWEPAVLGHLIQPSQLFLRTPGAFHWECLHCSRRHLDHAGGICTSCFEELPTDPVEARQPNDDYYAYRARSNDGGFRLHTEELSGQTDDRDATQRQARFQNIFLDDENSLIDSIDLLSVTTTMEAGVDIGSLRAVVMSNMPPMRFNYQQRVGRAGRRSDPFSFALTFCRARAHDEYYFHNPDRITNDSPPPPYIDLSREEILRRSLAALILCDFFRSHKSIHPDFVLGECVHGEFGSIETWTEVREHFVQWLRTHRSQIEPHLDSLLIRNEPTLREQRGAILEWAVGSDSQSLVVDIDKAVEVANTHMDLSQHLAERGVLPMFGFPTRVRNIYLRRPISSYPWPPGGTVDRDLELAVMNFSPGAETVRDKQVHVAVGLASFRPAGNRPVAGDPIGVTQDITLCKQCGSVKRCEDYVPDLCAECYASTPIYRRLSLAEPEGFRSSYRPRDFEGSFAFTARTTAPHILPELQTMRSVDMDHSYALSGRGDVFVVNDNYGQLFRFAPETNRDSWISVDLWQDPERRRQLDRFTLSNGLDLDHIWTGAMGMAKQTDALLIGLPDNVWGLNLKPYDPGRRGAWYSLGFLFRSAATRLLDIGVNELTVGYSVRHVDDIPHVEVFLADRLENGAGYCTQLGLSDQLRNLFDETDDFVGQLSALSHSQCDSSCPDCLRDYTNWLFHPLLDWRLARDLFHLFLGQDLDTTHWADEERLLARSFATDFDGEPIALDGGVWAVNGAHGMVIIRHPFEVPNGSFFADAGIAFTERIESAYIQATEIGRDSPISFVSSFDLQRRPGWVVANLG